MRDYSEEAVQKLGLCPFSSYNADGFRFSNVQPLAIVCTIDLANNEDFVMALLNRKRRILASVFTNYILIKQ